jgi:hypothetical protein
MPNQYELWLHRPSSKLYAVRLTRNNETCPDRIAGICGPLDPRFVPADKALATYRYQAGSFLQDLETKRDEFTALPRQAVSSFAIPADPEGFEILL